MSAIDQYKYEHIGFLNCPSDYPIVHGNTVRKVAVYMLEQDIPKDETSFDGKAGDILIGGGKGEAKSLRVSIPEIINFLSDNNNSIYNINDIRKSFWTPEESHAFCNGYSKLGWNPTSNIETWLADKTVKYLIFTNKLKSKLEVKQDELCPGLFSDSTFIRVQITRFVEHHQPDILEFTFSDYYQNTHKVIDKISVITDKKLSEESTYPVEEWIQIEVLSFEKNNDEEIYTIKFNESYGIETIEGKSYFEIRRDQIKIK